MKNLTDLPSKLILKIFKLLEYDDLIVLKRSNEDWTDLVRKCIESKIVVINESEENYELSLYDNNYLIGKSLITFRLNLDLHSKIKELVLFNPPYIFDLISFDSLIDFEIMTNKQFKYSGQLIFRFTNLESFTLRDQNVIGDANIVLEAPKLTFLWSDFNFNLFKIIHPYSIKILKVKRFQEIIKEMVNLEELNLFHFKIGDDLFNNLNILTNLKCFCFKSIQDDLISTNQYLQAIKSANPNLQLIYKNINLNAHPLQLDLIQTSNETLDDQSIKIYSKYLENLNNLDHSKIQIQNLELMTDQFIKKLTALETLIMIGQITDQQKWIQLLSVPNLNKIKIRSTVGQENLNLITTYCPFLTDLIIDRIENDEWLLRLKYLENLETNLFGFELFKKMIKKLNYLKTIRLGDNINFNFELGRIKCVSNGITILEVSKSFFLQTIDSCSFWSELLWNLEFN